MGDVSTTVVLALEGVLAGKDDDVVLTQTQLESTGHVLYACMARAGRLVLATNLDRRLVDHWCSINGLTGHSAITALDDRVVRRLRAAGEAPTLYIDANPERAAAALRDGVATMLFAQPLYARQSHRPDLGQPSRQWATIVAESQAQRAARARPVLQDDG